MTKANKNRRRGIECVELAIVLPIILLFTAGTLEICESLTLQKKLEVAAHEGARAAIRRGAVLSDVYDAARQHLDDRGISYSSDIASVITATPDPAVAGTLDPISVSIQVDCDSNLRLRWLSRSFFAGKKLGAEVSMLKEYTNQDVP